LRAETSKILLVYPPFCCELRSSSNTRNKTLVNFQLDEQHFLFIYIYNTFIKILYMFRAVRCLSSGCLIVSMQHLVSSLSVGDCPVHRFFLNRFTGQSPTESGDTRCCIDKIILPEDEKHTAQNM
jgi:hypothetical protein